MTSELFHALVTPNGKHIYKSNITCDKDRVNEMKLLMLMLMNALDDAYAHEMQVPNAMLNTRVLHLRSVTRNGDRLRTSYLP